MQLNLWTGADGSSISHRIAVVVNLFRKLDFISVID